ncbi:nitrogen fixation protein NifX [Alteraurantiacibacter aquimixticola]|uniref:Nitrogen fixation protein NifX n=1 Tax=Alteraurantiacibacter aquimixticola TaxID=2489173 RepID=A0A4T3F339_9SPHN|nr:nitrogen fixation protein NifX [Alteraurantiacibacter aquimixticola]TIX51633.1 nitrogen fixation protein NifX [Alteraurantiacibacter aquimixticola]
MKVAFATQDLERIDAHFGWARNLAIYDLTPEGWALDRVEEFSGELNEDGNEDKLEPKLKALEGVSILVVAAIGGSGAARVVAQNIHPMKVAEPEPIEGMLAKLQDVLKGTPPPWLRKILAKSGDRNFDFEEEEA